MRLSLAAWMLLFLPSIGLSCDVCGIFLGVRPNDRASTIGLFWRSRLMEGTTQVPTTSYLLKHGDHVPTGVPSRTVPMTEMVNVAELRADLRLTQRFFLLASVPMTNTYRSVNNYTVLDAYGMGDAFAMVRYQLVNTRCEEQEPLFVHRLLVGGGVKFPTGQDDLRVGENLASPDIQLGTGSWDGLASVEYSVRSGRTGLGVSMLGRYNTANAAGYQLGHGLSSTAELFHRFGSDTLSFAPAIGGYAEWMAHDQVDGAADHGTGGTTVFSHAGVRAWWKRFSFSAYYQHALLNNEGISITPTRHRIVTGLTYNIRNN